MSVAAAAAALQPTARSSAVLSAVSHVNGYTNPDVTCSAVSTSNTIYSSDKLHAIAVSVNDKNGISPQTQLNAVGDCLFIVFVQLHDISSHVSSVIAHL